MNELITDVKSLELETLKNLRNSKSVNTLRAYQADFKDFSLFCEKNGLLAIPTEPKMPIPPSIPKLRPVPPDPM